MCLDAHCVGVAPVHSSQGRGFAPHITTHEELDHNTNNTAAVELVLGACATYAESKFRAPKPVSAAELQRQAREARHGAAVG